LRLSYSDLLRNRAFRDLFLGQAISQLGDAFYYVAFMFMVKKVTHSDTMVGAVGALETLPLLIFGPYAGVLADRVDRRRIMFVSDVVCGTALMLFGVGIYLNGIPMVWMLLTAPFLLSSARVFFMPAKSASIPNIVPAGALMTANSLSMTVQNIMPMLSLSLSAAVLSVLYVLSPVVFYVSVVSINSVSFLASAFFISRLPKLVPDRKNVHDVHVLTDLRDGFRYLRTRHDMIVLTVLLAVFRLFVAPFFVVYLAANDKWFGGKPETVMWFECSFFVGMVVSSALLANLRPKHPAKWFCAGLALVGVTVGAMAFSPHFWLFILWNVLAGLAIPLADIPILAYIQTTVPDEFRGRVNAAREMVATGVMPVGMSAGGFMVSQLGLVTAFLIMGIGMTLACLVGLIDRRFRESEMPAEVAKELCGASPV
jgi:MFS transporter, DHA3 family, macrolide efflux protein